MTRRSFIASLLTGIVAPMVLPGAGRQWKRNGELWINDVWYPRSEIDMAHQLFVAIGDPPNRPSFKWENILNGNSIHSWVKAIRKHPGPYHPYNESPHS